MDALFTVLIALSFSNGRENLLLGVGSKTLDLSYLAGFASGLQFFNR